MLKLGPDMGDPTIACPANIMTNTAPGTCTEVVDYTASASDNRSGVTTNCAPPSGSSFFKGTTTVMCTATDDSGNMTSCSFTVTVNDAEPPTLTCPANILTNTAPGTCGRVVNYTATGSDNCPGLRTNCAPPSGSSFSKGTTTVTCIANDTSGSIVSCSFTVTVNDAEPPTITCSTNPTLVCTSTNGAQGFFTTGATDACDPAPLVTCTPPSGSFFGLGTNTIVQCVAVDASGNSNQCSFTITVVDAAPAVLSIVRQGADVHICWPSPCYILEETTTLNPPILWSTVSATITVVGDKNCVMSAIGSGNRFFRLRSP